MFNNHNFIILPSYLKNYLNQHSHFNTHKNSFTTSQLSPSGNDQQCYYYIGYNVIIIVTFIIFTSLELLRVRKNQ